MEAPSPVCVSKRVVCRQIVDSSDEECASDDISSPDDDGKVFSNVEHNTALRVEMLQSFETGLFSDLTIECQQKQFYVHRNIISMTCPYFRVMLSSNFRECSEHVIRMHEIDSGPFEDILRYLYSGEVKITQQNAVSIARLADMFELAPLHEFCCNYLCQKLACDNCLGFARYGRHLNSTKLEVASERFAQENFANVVKQEEFFSLSEADLRAFLRLPALNASDETQILRCAVAWLLHEPEERIEHFSRVLCSIQLQDVDLSYLKCLTNISPYLSENDETRDLIGRVIDHVLCKTPLPEQLEVLPPRIRTRLHKGILYFLKRNEEDRFAVCNSQIVPNSFVNAFVEKPPENEGVLKSVRYTEWERWAKKKSVRFHEGISCCAYDLTTAYAAGCGKDLDEIWKVDTVKRKWSFCCRMPSLSYHRLVAGFGSYLYILGGVTGVKSSEVSKDVRQYDAKLNIHENIGELHTPVYKFGAVFVNGKILVVGGVQMKMHRKYQSNIVDTFQLFDTLTRQCTLLRPALPFKEAITQALMLRGTLMVFTPQHVLCVDYATLTSPEAEQNGSQTLLNYQVKSNHIEGAFTVHVLGPQLLFVNENGNLFSLKWQELLRSDEDCVKPKPEVEFLPGIRMRCLDAVPISRAELVDSTCTRRR